MSHHALVFGASGILGWAVVNEILNNYPKSGTYAKVTALTNRPLSTEAALWPHDDGERPELNILSGIDLTQGSMEGMKEELKQRVHDIGSVTHIFYFAYLFHPDSATESEINLGMLRRGFGAAEALSKKLEYVILPTGTKGYGVHLGRSSPFKAPYVETMGDLPPPDRQTLFYYALRDELAEKQKGKDWKWAEVRCDIVTGFVPHANHYNFVAFYTNYLSLYKYMHDKRHPAAKSKHVRYPYPPATYHTLSNDGGQDTFARFSIFLCQDPERAGCGEVYNIASESTPRSMADRWPVLCYFFGLEGAPPVEAGDPAYCTPIQFMKAHAEEIEKMRVDKGVELQEVTFQEGIDMWFSVFDYDHHMVLEKARKLGFREELGFGVSWGRVFERYFSAGRVYIGV